MGNPALDAFDPYEPLARPALPPAPTLGEVASAHYTLGRQDIAGAALGAETDAYGPVVGALTRATGASTTRYVQVGAAQPVNADTVWRDVQAQRARDPAFLRDVQATDPTSFAGWVRGREEQRRKAAQATVNQQEGKLAGAVGFATDLATSLLDPINVGAMLATGGASAGGSLARTAAREAIVNGLTEAAELPVIAGNRQQFGETMTAGEMAGDVALAGAAGAAFPVGAAAMRGGARVAGRTAADLFPRLPRSLQVPAFARALAAGTVDDRALLALMAKRARDRTPEELDAAATLAGAVDHAETNPFVADGAGQVAHDARTREAVASIARGTAPSFAGMAEPDRPLAAVKAQIARFESGGSYTARNPQSTASGKYQFTDATWLGFARQAMPGQSDDALRALRSNPAAQERVMDRALGSYAGTFRRNNIAPTPGNLYLMHFLGPDALKVLHADPATPIERLIGHQAIDANGSLLRGRSAGEVVAEMDRRMGGGREALPTTEIARADEAPRPEEPPALPDAPVLRAEPRTVEAGSRPRTIRDDDPIGFLTELGGIRDDEGHALLTGRDLQTKVRGAGALIRPEGMSIDQAGERLWDAGWFGPPEVTERPTTADVLDLIERAKTERVRPVDRMLDEQEAARMTDSQRAESAASTALDGALHEWRESGAPVKLSRYERRWAMHRMAEGMDAHAAIETTLAATPHEIADTFGVAPEKVRTQPTRGPDLDFAFGANVDDEAGAVQHVAEAVRAEQAPASGRAAEFDDPAGQAAEAQGDQLLHDLRAELEHGDVALATEGLAGSDGDVAHLASSLARVLEQINADDAALAALGACL